MITRTCKRCSETKPIDDFKKDASRADGRRHVCKICSKLPAPSHEPRVKAPVPKALKAAVASKDHPLTKEERRIAKREWDAKYRQRKREAARAARQEKAVAERRSVAAKKSQEELDRRLRMARTNALKTLVLNHMTDFQRLFEKEKKALGINMNKEQWVSLHTMDDGDNWNATAAETPGLMSDVSSRVSVF